MLYPIGISYLIQLFSFIFVDSLRKSCSIRVVFFSFFKPFIWSGEAYFSIITTACDDEPY